MGLSWGQVVVLLCGPLPVTRAECVDARVRAAFRPRVMVRIRVRA